MVVCRYLGDVLLATPLAQSLTRAGYHVDWLVAPGTEGMLEGQPFADKVRRVGQHTPWHEQFRLGLRLLKTYDKAFALPATDRAMLMALAASGSRYALIDANRGQDAWKRRVCERWLDYAPGKHMVSLACELADAAGLPPCRSVQIQWGEKDEKAVFEALGPGVDNGFLHFHPFARWPYKWWRSEAWRELIARAADHGMKVAITGSAAETQAAERIAEGFGGKNVRILTGRLNWRQLACLSAHAKAYVGLDTANTHLAAATGAPVIALFGPTDPRIWGPWPNGFAGASPWQASSKSGIQRRQNISLLQGRQDCIPCQLEGCERRPDSISLCLKEMTADHVWREVEHRLSIAQREAG